jgi:hypothetical protein
LHGHADVSAGAFGQRSEPRQLFSLIEPTRPWYGLDRSRRMRIDGSGGRKTVRVWPVGGRFRVQDDPGDLQNRPWGADEASQVGSIPIHPRQGFFRRPPEPNLNLRPAPSGPVSVVSGALCQWTRGSGSGSISVMTKGKYGEEGAATLEDDLALPPAGSSRSRRRRRHVLARLVDDEWRVSSFEA